MILLIILSFLDHIPEHWLSEFPNCLKSLPDFFVTTRSVAMLNDTIKQPEKTIKKPNSLSGPKPNGSPCSSILINWHLKDLHSNPNCPYLPTSVGSKMIKDRIQPNTGVNVQAYLNFLDFVVKGKYTA